MVSFGVHPRVKDASEIKGKVKKMQNGSENKGL